MTTTVGNAIKNRASNEEILIVLKDVPNPNQDDDDGGSSFWSHDILKSLANHSPTTLIDFKCAIVRNLQ